MASTGDVRFIREKWTKFIAWHKKLLLRQPKAVQPAVEVASNAVENHGLENAIQDAYAKGYQDGLKAALPDRQDCAIPSGGGGGPASPSSTEGNRCGCLILRQMEKRGFNAGWNKAWEVLKKEGWTKGCYHCSQHLRHPNVVQRRNSVVVRDEVLDIPDISSPNPGTRKTKAWSTTAVTGRKHRR